MRALKEIAAAPLASVQYREGDDAHRCQVLRLYH